jgi:hypothetical protein
MLSVTTLCLGITSGSAQTTKPSQPPAQTTSQTDAKKLTPPPGKLRGTTNEMRMAAATRNADRKTQAQKKAATATPQGEVKQ